MSGILEAAAALAAAPFTWVLVAVLAVAIIAAARG